MQSAVSQTQKARVTALDSNLLSSIIAAFSRSPLSSRLVSAPSHGLPKRQTGFDIDVDINSAVVSTSTGLEGKRFNYEIHCDTWVKFHLTPSIIPFSHSYTMRSNHTCLYLATLIAQVICDDVVDGKLSFYSSSWEGWNKNTARWSAYEAPTFSAVFKPETEGELSQGVGDIPYIPVSSVISWLSHC